MNKRVGIGIIGVGRRWRRRYRMALDSLRKHFAVRALCDPVHQRAVHEAKALGCAAAAGPTAVLERDDVDAVLVLETSWYGLWPVEAALRVRKPVLCCASLEADNDHADDVLQQVKVSKVPVLMGLLPRYAPAFKWLQKEASEVSSPQLVFCEWIHPCKMWKEESRESRWKPTYGILGCAGLALVESCLTLMTEEPLYTSAAVQGQAGHGSLWLGFKDERAIHIVRRPGLQRRSSLQLHFQFEDKLLRAELPGRVAVGGAAGWQDCHCGWTSLAQNLLVHFHQVVGGGREADGIESVHLALVCLRAARRSIAAGQRVSLGQG